MSHICITKFVVEVGVFMKREFNNIILEARRSLFLNDGSIEIKKLGGWASSTWGIKIEGEVETVKSALQHFDVFFDNWDAVTMIEEKISELKSEYKEKRE